MSFGNASNLERARHYEEAHRYFTQTAKPRSSKWSGYERPLGTAAQHHYRIVQGDEGRYYDVILYATTMARFYAPNSAGETRICYNGDSRVTSTQFMWQVLHVGAFYQLRDTENVLRCVPIGSQRSFSTDLWFNKEGQLLVKCSTHAPIVSLHASKSLSEWKADLKRKLDPLICLMEIAVQETLDDGVGSGAYDAGRAFSSPKVNANAQYLLKAWVEEDCPKLTAHGVEHLRDLYITCATFIIDRRLYSSTSRGSYHKITQYTQPKPAAVTTSVLNYLAKFAPYSVTKNEHRPLPQFPTELPSKWCFT